LNSISYTLVTIDSWGDGWNGAELSIQDSESNTLYSFTMEDGDREEVEFTVEYGCYLIVCTEG
jgi:hypothetical protein